MNYGTSKLTSKGQITIPIALRKAMDLNKGDYLSVFTTEDVIVMKPMRTLEEPAVEEELYLNPNIDLSMFMGIDCDDLPKSYFSPAWIHRHFAQYNRMRKKKQDMEEYYRERSKIFWHMMTNGLWAESEFDELEEPLFVGRSKDYRLVSLPPPAVPEEPTGPEEVAEKAEAKEPARRKTIDEIIALAHAEADAEDDAEIGEEAGATQKDQPDAGATGSSS